MSFYHSDWLQFKSVLSKYQAVHQRRIPGSNCQNVVYEYILASSTSPYSWGLRCCKPQDNSEIWPFTRTFWGHMKWVVEHILRSTLSTSTHCLMILSLK